ncbi:phage baseplate assembly protein [Burkholderia cepacia]|uniref:phage baseplate assembly protein domain-containing protein n=1 Tax=Burkholderia cepacia TaxID=292 RepID=UPI0026510474|nr:phage baseplate assembly protein [Burkholderia cepacia]MDN7900153.1 phage baseplate assembly protein [Burkholderia cepacia]
MDLLNLLRRALFRNLREGPVQTVSVRVFDTNARDDAERHQDYGFAGNPVDGQGLVIEAGGHTVVLRMDRIDSRPRLEAYEVAVWHKDGHKILLSNNGKISVTCTDFDVTADNITLNGKNGVSVSTPKMSTSEALQVGTRAEIGQSLKIGDQEFVDHQHDSVQRGNDLSGGVAG